ncbi:acyltransferase [Elusimicrobiota bacterium]
MIPFFKRLRILSKVQLVSETSEFYFSKQVDFELNAGASIEVHGKVTIGFPLPGTGLGFPAHDKTVISLGKNARLKFLGDTFIANGSGLYVGENGVFTFAGNNFIAHNSLFLCKKEIWYGKNSSSSWNFTAIDDDNHSFYHTNGTPVHKKPKPLIIGDNVAIQVNVIIPAGVTIGANSIIGAGTVIRQDIPPNVRAYGKQEMRIKEGVTYGFQFQPRNSK